MHSKVKKILTGVALSLSLVLSISAFIPQATHAQLTVCGDSTPDQIADYQKYASTAAPNDPGEAAVLQRDNICSSKDIFPGFARIINALIGYIGVFVILRIIIVGFQMILANGNQEAITTQKSHLTNALIGLVIVLISYVLVNWIFSIFQLQGSFSFSFNPFS